MRLEDFLRERQICGTERFWFERNNIRIIGFYFDCFQEKIICHLHNRHVSGPSPRRIPKRNKALLVWWNASCCFYGLFSGRGRYKQWRGSRSALACARQGKENEPLWKMNYGIYQSVLKFMLNGTRFTNMRSQFFGGRNAIRRRVNLNQVLFFIKMRWKGK